MKRIFAVSLFALALCFALPPLLLPAGARPLAEAAAEQAAEVSGEDAGGAASAADDLLPADPADRADAAVSLRLLTAEGTVETLSLADYLPAALAGEMPAAFEPEALRAQAVALRTYALYCQAHPKSAHPDADLCARADCCCAWLDEETLRERWGDDHAANRARLEQAVADTDGETLVWEGEPILAVFHAASQGRTEDGAALGLSVPYLKSVETPETPERVRQLVTTVEVAPAELAATLTSLNPEADFSGSPEDWLGPVSLDAAGRVSAVVLGGRQFSALALRQAFGLRSTDFTLVWDGGAFTFRVRGYGHGLGLSQHGAELMAEAGASYLEILAHYYPGAEPA
ncbi:MAG: SpoIID/LytB domain-containing protein [Oscillospiraceae bacterium]|nr:SpoIID/LytB domain-containing protein [Oscillospiraceae bacterium]